MQMEAERLVEGTRDVVPEHRRQKNLALRFGHRRLSGARRLRNTPLLYRFGLPTANHVFLPGHRIMVQIQSSWFPLYDRNTQTFVPSIFWAKPEDYRKADQRVYHASGEASFIELPLVTTP